MKKLAFVTPWFGASCCDENVLAVAELVRRLHAAGVALDVLTTGVRAVGGDWARNSTYPGTELVDGIPVKRFWADARHAPAYEKVAQQLAEGRTLDLDTETIYVNQSVNSDDLYDYIRLHREDYGLFVFAPFQYGTSYFGAAAAGGNAVLLPCFHSDAVAAMRLFVLRYAQARGMIFLSDAERAFAHSIYPLEGKPCITPGFGVEIAPGDAARFCEKFHIDAPFALYYARRDASAETEALLQDFSAYRQQYNTPLKLVLMGGGEIFVPDALEGAVVSLPYVCPQDRFDACAAAAVLLQADDAAAFPTGLLQGLLAGRAALVSGKCPVAKEHALASGGGLCYDTPAEFAVALDRLLQDAPLAEAMGQNGRAYVQAHYNWDTVTQQYLQFFNRLCGEE